MTKEQFEKAAKIVARLSTIENHESIVNDIMNPENYTSFITSDNVDGDYFVIENKELREKIRLLIMDSLFEEKTELEQKLSEV